MLCEWFALITAFTRDASNQKCHILWVKLAVKDVSSGIFRLRTQTLHPQTQCQHDLLHGRYSIVFGGTITEVCATSAKCNIAVCAGTAIALCCLFDMQRSAVEQLHGLC